jgi:replicative DNA helicase
MAVANLRRDIPIGLFSLEMSKAEILHRLWSAHGRIPFHAIRNPRGLDPDVRLRIKRAMGEVACWPLFVQDGSLSIQRLAAKARLLIRQEKVKLLIVDYLQIVLANAKDERERLTRISSALRELAKSEGVPVIAISQLNRPRDGSLNARPNKFSLKDTADYRRHFCSTECRGIDKEEKLQVRRAQIKTGRCPMCHRSGSSEL